MPDSSFWKELSATFEWDAERYGDLWAQLDGPSRRWMLWYGQTPPAKVPFDCKCALDELAQDALSASGIETKRQRAWESWLDVMLERFLRAADPRVEVPVQVVGRHPCSADEWEEIQSTGKTLRQVREDHSAKYRTKSGRLRKLNDRDFASILRDNGVVARADQSHTIESFRIERIFERSAVLCKLLARDGACESSQVIPPGPIPAQVPQEVSTTSEQSSVSLHRSAKPKRGRPATKEDQHPEVVDFLSKVAEKDRARATFRCFAAVAGYRDDTILGWWRFKDARSTHGHEANFRRVLQLSSDEFLSKLEK
jgi:hypothetical protein